MRDHEPRELTLWLVRHAAAAERAIDGVDAHRPLVAKGIDQARHLATALTAWEVRPDVVLTSPWLRAVTTAETLAGAAPLRRLDALAQGDASLASAAIAAALGPEDHKVVVVGHEPWLAALASWWLCGREGGVAIEFRKASALALAGVPAPGRMTLTGFVPVRWVKALRRGG
jgi:phosphohistidine phosphatase